MSSRVRGAAGVVPASAGAVGALVTGGVGILLLYNDDQKTVAPARAVTADDETSEAKRAITVPLALGWMTPSITATLPTVMDVELDAAGTSYAVALFTVWEVVVRV
jgi:hypothetical protein